MQIVYGINAKLIVEAQAKPGCTPDFLSSISLIDEHHGRRLRMGQLAFVGSHSINGVSALHTSLMKESVFRDLNKLYPGKTASRVEITLKNGEKITRQVDMPAGDPRDPMTSDAVAKKVRLFAGKRDAKKLNAVIDGILTLETVTDITQITKNI